MEKKKESFLLYHSFWDSLRVLSDVQLGLLFRAIYCFVLGLDPPSKLKNDGFVWMAFTFIHNQIKIDTEKYEQICRTRSDAGIKSGLARRSTRHKKEPEKEHVFEETNNFQSLPHLPQKEQMIQTFGPMNTTDKSKHNGGVYEAEADIKNDDDNSDVNVSMGVTTTINTDYFEYYKIMYFRNLRHPKAETVSFIQYYEDQLWTLRGGRILKTIEERCKKAMKWIPHESNNSGPRVNVLFLNMWQRVWDRLWQNTASEEILQAALDERINIRYSSQQPDKLFIILPKIVVDYLYSTKLCHDIFGDYRKETTKERVTNTIELIAIEDIKEK